MTLTEASLVEYSVQRWLAPLFKGLKMSHIDHPYILCWEDDYGRLCPMGYSKNLEYVKECYETHKKDGYKIYKLIPYEVKNELFTTQPRDVLEN